MSHLLIDKYVDALLQTLLMVSVSAVIAITVGLLLAVVLTVTGPHSLYPRPRFNKGLSITVNIFRAIPFIILLVALVPITRVIAGTSIGPLAAAVPLSVAAIPYFARLVDQCLREVPRGVIEAAHAMGASELQIVWRVLVVEARSGLVLALTVLSVSFLSYSAIAGVVGGGGIGDLAIRYGYYRFQTDVMVFTVVLLVALVQIIQFVGNTAARRLDKR